MSVRNRVLPAGNQRVFGVAVIASIMVGAACHNGVETPISPSVTSASVPTATSAALAVGDDTATTRGGPMSVVMNEQLVGPEPLHLSGFSGTCTIGTGGAGFRIKASGQGVPGQSIRFILEIQPTETDPTPGRYTDITRVDDRGNFRTGGERVTYIPSGASVRCAVLPEPGTDVLAQTQDFFPIP